MKALGWLLWLFPLYLLTTGQLVAWLDYATTGGSSSSSSSTGSSAASSQGFGGIFANGILGGSGGSLP